MSDKDFLIDANLLRTSQYSNDGHLRKRIARHERFGTSPKNWYEWLFDQVVFPDDSRILELGCGTGMFWHENAFRLPPGVV